MSDPFYTEKQIRSLDWKAHIRLRPGMYIGQIGEGQSAEDGIYLLFKEVVDNGIDEYLMGFGQKIVVRTSAQRVHIRDYGRGIPLGKLYDCVAKMNTGGKYDTQAFQRSIGLNGVGLKAVNALSSYFEVISYRQGKGKRLLFERGVLQAEETFSESTKKDGTEVIFVPDAAIFSEKYAFDAAILKERVAYYAYLNPGLTLTWNGTNYRSKEGLKELLATKVAADQIAYPVVALQGASFSVVFTHHTGSERYYTFVNGQPTPQGGTHLSAFKEAILKQLRQFYKKQWEGSDVRQQLIAAISIRLQDPLFESQTKTKLSAQKMGPNGESIRRHVQKSMEALDTYLHQHKDTAAALLQQLKTVERERKALTGIKKLAREKARKAHFHNKKLRDCTIHYNSKKQRRAESTLFVTEGGSASGSITQVRDVRTQGVFSLKGKPLNSYGHTRKVVYEHEEFNLLQHALNIEKGLAHLRYNKIILATDADVDGMHIRLLLLTYFLQFFPELIQEGHVYILETPLFRVRQGDQTFYCYTEKERDACLLTHKKKAAAEVTRFKGLGEISPKEFAQFIGKEMRLTPVVLRPDQSVEETLRFYMGKNTPERQRFIIENLRGLS